MSTTRSKSPKKDDHLPTPEERDDNFSTGAGRKAVEVPKADRKECDTEEKKVSEKKLEAPIGLDNETRADRP